MTLDLRGILAPVVTTFANGGDEVDREAFAANLRAHLAAGLDGIVVGGSTGEAVLLDETERRVLVETARGVVPREKLLIAGVGAESTRTTLRYAKVAAESGADAVLVVAPHYYAPAMVAEALEGHYRRVADESPVPVILYNIPKYMHFSLAPMVVHDLARHQNVIGIKDSSGDLDLLSTYLTATADSFAVLTGNGSTFMEALRMGARGGILAVALFAPQLCRDIAAAMSRADAAAAAAAQAKLVPLSARIVGDLGIAGVKAAMDDIGLHGGALRPPLRSLSTTDQGRVTDLLRAADLLPQASMSVG